MSEIEFGDAGFPVDPCWAYVEIVAAGGKSSSKKGTRSVAIRVKVLESSQDNIGEVSTFMDNWISPKLTGKVNGFAKACGQPFPESHWFEPNPPDSINPADPGDTEFVTYARKFKGAKFLAKIKVEVQKGYDPKNSLDATYEPTEDNLIKWRKRFVKTQEATSGGF